MPKLPCGGVYEGSAAAGFGKKCKNLLCDYCDKPWEYIYKAKHDPESLKPKKTKETKKDE